MASKKPSGLGRGLGALLGDDVLKTETTGALYLPITDVESNSSQPRKNFDEDARLRFPASAAVAPPLRSARLHSPASVAAASGAGLYQGADNYVTGYALWRKELREASE